MDSIEHVYDISLNISSICDSRKYCTKCPHGRQKAYCKECGGSQFCVHERRKSTCKECKGSQVCQHNKIKYYCIECHGSSICEHSRVKSSCKECGGSTYCAHGITKSYCKECHGTSICEHNNNRKRCKQCGGNQICEHNLIKYICQKCKGSQICEHNTVKYVCKLCKGSQICDHNINRAYCKLCHGRKICQHNKKRVDCVECMGRNICEHNKRKVMCRACDGSHLCKSEWCTTSGNKKYNGYCLLCCVQFHPEITVSRNYKTKERAVADHIKTCFPEVSWACDTRPLDACSYRRPDMLLDMGSHVIIIEVDENQHKSYDSSCDNKRLMEISKDIQHRPLILIRFNPDSYIDASNNKIASCWTYGKSGVMRIKHAYHDAWVKRLASLRSTVQYWISNIATKTIHIIQLYFDGYIHDDSRIS